MVSAVAASNGSDVNTGHLGLSMRALERLEYRAPSGQTAFRLEARNPCSSAGVETTVNDGAATHATTGETAARLDTNTDPLMLDVVRTMKRFNVPLAGACKPCSLWMALSVLPRGD
jgi:hypothetical protein